jgi:osmotically-inducible protein OsmY
VWRTLKADRHLGTDSIAVSERDAIVTLGGKVSAPLWRERAAVVTAAVQEVRAVRNQIHVEVPRRSDEALARDVSTELHQCEALSALPMVVKAARGVVELRGNITSYEEQRLATRVVLGVPGARFCQNSLSFSARIPRTAALIRGDVQSRLDWDAWLCHHDIRVLVRGRSVALAGSTRNSFERRRAESAGWAFGVDSVDVTQLGIDEASGAADLRSEMPSDSEVARAIQDLAEQSPFVSLSGLSIVVVAGVVMLSGNVPSPADRDRVEWLARSVVGVSRVKNGLRGRWSPAPVAPAPARRTVRSRGARR